MPMPKKPRNLCRFCGLAVKRVPDVYCNRDCQREHERHLKDEVIRVSGDGTPRTIKGFLVRERGHACEICGGTHWREQLIPLVLDHIDGNAENNSLTNLRLVCGNCDMQLPTFKSRNLGNGRHLRRERYAAGKSY